MNNPTTVYFTWQKGNSVQISEFFFTSEFVCPCTNIDCQTQRISLELIRRLDWVRKAAGSGLRIHKGGGFRCRKYQEELQRRALSGEPGLTVVATTSSHELGHAADFSCGSLTIQQLKPIVEQKFKSIGTALSFLHVDLRDDRVRRWKY